MTETGATTEIVYSGYKVWLPLSNVFKTTVEIVKNKMKKDIVAV